METQEQAVLTHLQEIGAITPLQALHAYGCFRLADVIYKLRKKGHSIETKEKREGRKQFAEYHYAKA